MFNITKYVTDPLYKSSFYIGSTRVLGAFLGFFFWMIAARNYSIEDVGIAAALITTISLIFSFSRLGLDISMRRFIPLEDKAEIINTSLWLTTLAVIIAGLIYLKGLDSIASNSDYMKNPTFFLIIIFSTVYSITYMTGNAFISLRESEYYFAQNLLLFLRIPFLFILKDFGGLGIFSSFGLAYIATSALAILLMTKSIKVKLNISRKFLRKTFRFSFINYIADVLSNIPSLAIPILILNVLGPKDAAIYYIAFSIGSLILIIPDALSTSLLVEGSYGSNLKKSLKRSLIGNFALLIPISAFIFLFGNNLLELFGSKYVDAAYLLNLFILSSFFISIYFLSISVYNINLQISSIFWINLVRLILLLSLSYIFMLKFGIAGVGYAWIIVHGFLAMFHLCLFLISRYYNKIPFKGTAS